MNSARGGFSDIFFLYNVEHSIQNKEKQKTTFACVQIAQRKKKKYLCAYLLKMCVSLKIVCVCAMRYGKIRYRPVEGIHLS